MKQARIAGAIGLTLVAMSCASPPVHTERAMQREPVETPSTSTPGTVAAPDDPAQLSTLDWTPCDDTPSDLTQAWECASLPVPLDRADPTGAQIDVALTRPVLDADDHRTPLLFNPGGPGGSGIDLVWYLTDLLPTRLLEHFYPVGWDPRGVGRSTPPIDCGPVDDGDVPDPTVCTARTGALLAEVGAPDSAEDMESIRAALGVDRLDYVGYSYGTALGSVYTMAHPEHVGRFVLDGAIDPTAGDPNGELSVDGVPDYAADELDDVIDRFHQLCDATSECAAGPDSAAVVDALRSTIRDLPTEYFDGDPDQLTRFDLEDLMVGITFDPWSWGLVGDALADAADGDASALAALSSYLLQGYPVPDPEDAVPPFDDAANFAIYCADFSDIHGQFGCDGMPAADPLPAITTVDVAEPILVVGTTWDPLTPGRHADELAAALGDAVSIRWDGIGHTAFPVSECLDGAVVDYLVDGSVPDPALVCPMMDGVKGDEAIGDNLFEYPPWWIEQWLETVLNGEGMGEDQAACVAGELSTSAHRVITHILIGVHSPAAIAERDRAIATC